MSALTTIRLRRGTAAQWSTANPILADGEEGFEKDTKRSKVGDGVTRWNTLGYTAASSGGGTSQGTPVDYITIRRSDGSIVQATLDTNNVWNYSGTTGGGGTSNPPDTTPPATTTATIDDDDTGTANMKVEYKGADGTAGTSLWVDFDDGSGHTYHYSVTTNETATIRFTGTGIVCKFTFENLGGIGTYKLDAADPVSFDTYNASQTFDTTGFTLTGLSNGAHTLIIKNTGTRNPANTSSASVIAFSSAVATQSAAVVLPPVLGTPTPLVGSGSFAAGTYKAVATSVDASGNETNGSNEVTVTIAASGRVTFPFTVATGAVTTRIYMTAVGGAAGSEQWKVATVTAPTATVTVTTLGSTAGTVPGSNVTVTYDPNGMATNSLVISSSTGDTNGIVTGTMSLISNVAAGKSITDVCISVRDSSGNDVGTLDFPHLGPQTIGTTPYSPTPQTITLSSAGTYTFFPSYNLAGSWNKLQAITRTLTVVQATSGSNTGGTATSNPALSVGARSGLPWNDGVQGYGQNVNSTQSFINARTQFEQRGKNVDAQQQAQYVFSFAELESNMATLQALPRDALAVVDITPGWGPGGSFTSSWAHIAAGTEDAHFFNLGANSANFCVNSRGNRPWGARWGWEANGKDWYPWQVGNTGDTDASFRAGWNRAAKQFKAGAASVGHANMVINVYSSSGLDRNSGYNPLTQLYPGDDAVDVISIDFYDHNQWEATASTPTKFGWEVQLDAMMTFAIQHGKWMAIDEWGLVNKSGTPGSGQGGDNPSFFTGFYNWMRKTNPLLGNQPNYTRIAWVLYFEDIDDNNVHSSLWADSRNPLSRARYTQELAKGGTA